MASQILSSQELERVLPGNSTAAASSTALLDPPILSLLASTGRKSLAKLMTEQQYVPGEVVFREDDPGDAMYIIWSGRVVVLKGSFESPTILGYRGVGEIIGEMALLENQPRSASVVALEDLRLLRVSRENFGQLLSSNPAVGMSILEALSARLRAADEARTSGLLTEKQLTKQVSELQTEKQQLLELQRLRQETIDLIIHDLRNPLGLMSGAITMLEMTLPDDILEASRDIMDLAKTNSAHMKRLVESLLDVAQMEAGEVHLLLAAVTLPELITKTVKRMATLLKKNNIAIQASIPDDLPTVVVDEEKIDRVLANLIDNAVKHTLDEGYIAVAAELKDGQVLVSVANTGPSIPPEDRDRIFDRFTQAPGGRPKNRGFGLGLAFCRLAVEAHGGRIWVEADNDGRGNRFVFSLPLSVQAQSPKSSS